MEAISREREREGKVFALGAAIALLVSLSSSFFGKGKKPARNGPTFSFDLILTDHVAFGHSSSNSRNGFLLRLAVEIKRDSGWKR